MRLASSPRRNARGPRSWGRAALRGLVVLVAMEAVLRVAFFFYARVYHPNCGLRPELLARLLFAYSHPLASRDAPGHDGIVPDPHRGYRHVGGLHQQEVHGVVMSTNRRGMRGSHEYEVPKPPGVVRVVAIGDSFTFGEGLTDDATWPAQLERDMPGIEVANLGEPAYAHDQMYFALEDEGLRLQPDAVILGYYENDAWRDELTFYCAEKPRLSPGPEGWHFENEPVPAPWEVRDRYLRLPLLYALPRVILESTELAPETDHSGDARATELLRRTGALAASVGARFILVNLPDRPGDAGESRDFFDGYCKQTGTECVDPSPLFQAVAGTSDPALLRARFQRPNDIHYSKEGYAVVADALRRYFSEHSITQPQPQPRPEATPP